MSLQNIELSLPSTVVSLLRQISVERGVPIPRLVTSMIVGAYADRIRGALVAELVSDFGFGWGRHLAESMGIEYSEKTGPDGEPMYVVKRHIDPAILGDTPETSEEEDHE